MLFDETVITIITTTITFNAIDEAELMGVA